MGNVSQYCGNQQIEVYIGPDRATMVPRPDQGIKVVELWCGDIPTTINYQTNNILFKPSNQEVIKEIQKVSIFQEDSITQKMELVESIKTEGERSKAIHYMMKEQEKTEEETKAQTQKVIQTIMNAPQNEQKLSFDQFKEINDGFKSVGVDLNWVEKRGVASALSIHVLSGLTGNMVRCTFKETDEARSFQYLIENNALLEEHYQEIKETIARKFEINKDYITILEIEKGSVKTTFVVNLDHIRSKLESKDGVTLSSYQNLQIHPYFEQFKLSPDDFDPIGNYDYTEQPKTREERFKWQETQRAGMTYKKPFKCKRYGLNVWDRYDDGNNNWIFYGHPDEWAIAYHGVNSPGGKVPAIEGQETNQKDRPFVLNKIMEQRMLKPGVRNMYGGYNCINKTHKPGCKIPFSGIYLTSEIETAMGYAKPREIRNKKMYKLAFQCRVHPKHAHLVLTLEGDMVHWVVEESMYIRPYAILLQEELKINPPQPPL